MALGSIALELAIIVGAMLATTTIVVVGPRRAIAAVRSPRWRLRAVAAPLSVLAGLLVLRWWTQDLLPRVSWRILGTNITPFIFETERRVFGENPVAVLQSFQTDELTALFAFVYIYGYAFLLLFPLIAYFALETMEDLSNLLLAFAANYGIGLLCYVLFIAYGPRNFDQAVFAGLLYDTFPNYAYLTHTVNQTINVFPSLHTSMAVTVFAFAWFTREEYPLWTPIAGVLAVGVVVSTMYLGIHWLSDVIAGTALAAISVYVGVTYTVEELAESARDVVDDAVGRRGEGSGE